MTEQLILMTAFGLYSILVAGLFYLIGSRCSKSDTPSTSFISRHVKSREQDQEYDDPWNEAMNSTQERIDTI